MDRRLFFLFPLFIPSVSWGAEYYTYGSFTQIVDAFKRLALIFNDTGFSNIVFGIIGLGAIVMFYQVAVKRTSMFVAGIPILVGLIVFSAGVIPKRTIHIYDEQLNLYEPVSGIPFLITGVVIINNSIERGFREIIHGNPAAVATTELRDTGLSMLVEATRSSGRGAGDYHNMKTLAQYFADCAPVAPHVSGNSFSIEDLRNGAQDPMSSMAELALNGVFTVAYSSSQQQGVAVTCADAWSTQLQPWLQSPATSARVLDSLCRSSGLSVADPNQYQACQDELALAVSSSTGNASISIDRYLQNRIISNAIYDALSSGNPAVGLEMLVNKSMAIEGIGSWTMLDSWVPTIRGVVTSSVLALMAVLVAFLPTPFFGKVFALIFALFFFLCLWGILDQAMYVAALDQASRVFNQSREFYGGLVSHWLTPSEAMKALSMLMEARSSALTMAAFLAATICGVSVYGLMSQASSYSRDIEQHSKQEAANQLDPSRSNAYVESLSQGEAVNQSIGQEGYNAMVSGKKLLQGESMGMAAATASVASTPVSAGLGVGGVAGAARAGNFGATEAEAEKRGTDTFALAESTASIETSSRIGSTEGVSRAADQVSGGDVAQMSGTRSEVDQAKGYSHSVLSGEAVSSISENSDVSRSGAWQSFSRLENPAAATVKAADGDRGAIDQLVDTQAGRNLGSNLGFSDTAQSLGKDSESLARAEGSIQAAESSGGQRVLSEKGAGAFESSAYVGKRQAITNMEEVLQTAGRNGGLDDLQRTQAQADVAGGYGRSLALLQTASALGMQPEEGSRVGSLSGFTFAVAPEQAQALEQRGVINQEQARTLSENGGTVTATINPSTLSGSVSTAAATGDSTRVDDSYTLSTAYVEDHSARVDTQHTRSDGFNFGNGGINTLQSLRDPVAVEGALRTENGAYMLAQQMGSGMSSMLGMNKTSANTSSVSTGGSLSAGKSASNSPPTPNTLSEAPQAPGSSGAGVSLGMGYSEFAQNTTSANANIMAASSYRAIEALGAEARARGLDNNEAVQFVANGISDIAQRTMDGTFKVALDEAKDTSMEHIYHQYFKESNMNTAAGEMEASWTTGALAKIGIGEGLRHDVLKKDD